MNRRLRPDRKAQRQAEATQRQAEYDTLTTDEKLARSEAWRRK
jgi:hypothetical protein